MRNQKVILMLFVLNRVKKNHMLSEISVKVFRSGRKLVGPAETDIV
jgi:hypothetical protein